ncbi:PREDICTED: uncharacterized protein LOC105142715 [Populus euphratica]|uniref:Uncharacterized protein LOC105142715 n=1 Tax=Populus euphratica TaxID=75702 RepID=A0AAJ6YAS6_POPEU|nr:PREDICTED: uncharacterized protein LOC105142715 [Populus euphratica]
MDPHTHPSSCMKSTTATTSHLQTPLCIHTMPTTNLSSTWTSLFSSLPVPSLLMAQQKVVLKVLTMTDDKTKKKAIEAAADIFGVDSIAVDLKDQKLTVIGLMDTVAVVKKLKKVGDVAHKYEVLNQMSRSYNWNMAEGYHGIVAQRHSEQIAE